MRKLMVLILIVFLLTGCTGGGVEKAETTRKVTLTLAGIPNKPAQDYELAVYAVDANNEIELIHVEHDVDHTDVIKLDLMLSSNVKSFQTILYSWSFQHYDYIWQEPVTQSVSDYTIEYWMLNRDVVTFGVSDYHLINDYEIAESGLYLDFDVVPYYYIRLSEAANVFNELYLQAWQGRIEVEVEQRDPLAPYIIDEFLASVENGSDLLALPQFSGELFLVIRPGDYMQRTTGALAFDSHKGLSTGALSQLITTKHNQIILGFLPRTLVYINPITQEIEQSFSLDDYQSSMLVYDGSEDLLYIYNGSKVGLWDVEKAYLVEKIELDSTLSLYYACGFAVAPKSDRVYLFDNFSNKLGIYELSSGNLIVNLTLGFTLENLRDVVIDENEGKLFLWRQEGSYYQLFRCSIAGDQLVVEQVLAGVESLINYNEDLSQVMIYHDGRIKVVSTLDFTKVFASSSYLPLKPDGLSVDGQYLYGKLNNERGIHNVIHGRFFILDTSDFSNYHVFTLPFSLSKLALCNDNGIALVYSGSKWMLYFVKTYLNQAIFNSTSYRDSIVETHSELEARRTVNEY